MAVYVDSEAIFWRDKLWCHMAADSLEELHSFARRLGLKRSWFQENCRYPHYDITMEIRDNALKLGAIDSDRPTIINRCKILKRELSIVQDDFWPTGF
ncbi:DUF4031 domain-containing protein [Stenotrophomonas pavanii]|uniref:DUF4031 domain-containing protein n=1 Tax=Stenotrophomonas maltophilia group TaxID=995085 RepID=UPI0015F47755|nr:DUF4031 domain-containing protein [Stenotrophomonas maltophilia]